MRQFIIFLLSISMLLFACGNPTIPSKKHKPDPKAALLYDSAMAVVQNGMVDNRLKYVSAIELLEKATDIDSNYYSAYWNKKAFQMQIMQFDQALISTKHLIRLKPRKPDFYAGAGILCEITGDSIAAINYYQKASTLYDAILDTLSVTNKNYDLLLMDKGLNLIMLGQEENGNRILKQLYDKQSDEVSKDVVLLYMNKTREDLLSLIREKRIFHKNAEGDVQKNVN